MNALRVRIQKQGSGRNFIGVTEDGHKFVFHQLDKRLAVGTDVDVSWIQVGDSVNVPLVYELPRQPRKPIGMGVIVKDFVHHGNDYLFDYWSAETDGERYYMNLNKRTGPSDVGIGTVVEIYEIARKGVVHTYVDGWGRAERQYPAAPLTDEQRAMVERLRRELNGGVVGTVALKHSPFDVVVLDEPLKRGYLEETRVTDLYTPQTGSFPVGIRVLVGWTREGSREMVYRL